MPDKLPATESPAPTFPHLINTLSADGPTVELRDRHSDASSASTEPPGKAVEAAAVETGNVKVCCNALYGSSDLADSPAGSVHSMIQMSGLSVHSMIPMSGLRVMEPEDAKENLAPGETPMQACCLIHSFAKEAADASGHGIRDKLPQLAAGKVSGLLNGAVRSAAATALPLQPCQAVSTWSGSEALGSMPPFSLLPVPMATAIHPSHLPEQLIRHRSSHMHSDSSISQPVSSHAPADECLFGSPPHGQTNHHLFQHATSSWLAPVSCSAKGNSTEARTDRCPPGAGMMNEGKGGCLPVCTVQ